MPTFCNEFWIIFQNYTWHLPSGTDVSMAYVYPGTCRALWTSTRGKSAYFTFNVKPAALRVLQVAARWNSCWSISCRLGCTSSHFTRSNYLYLGCSQKDLSPPRLNLQSSERDAQCQTAHMKPENPSGVRCPTCLLDVTLPEPAKEKLLKISTTEFLLHLSQAMSRLHSGLQ